VQMTAARKFFTAVTPNVTHRGVMARVQHSALPVNTTSWTTRVSVGVHLAASQTRAVCAGHAMSHVRLVPVLARTAA